MLIFNIIRVMQMRNIDKPHAFLTQNGFSRQTASTLINDGLVQVKVKHLERLCAILNCAPNDLFEWRADKNSLVAENHALRSLTREKNKPSISEIISEMPLEKMERIGEMLAGVEESEK